VHRPPWLGLMEGAGASFFRDPRLFLTSHHYEHTVVENKSMWIVTSKSKAAIQIEAERQRMLTAHRAFLAITRSEMKEFRFTRRRRSRMTRGVRRTGANGDVLLTAPSRVEKQFGRLGPSDLT
jgi:hypothetical protein